MNQFKILLVEDDPWDVKIFQRMMQSEQASFELIVANQLSKALDYLAHIKIDLVLLDLGLPDSQGIESLASLLQQAPGMPIIVVTGSDNEDLPLKAVEMGACDYLIKEMMDTLSLKRAIRYAIERHMLLTEIEQTKRAIGEFDARFRKFIDEYFLSIIVVDMHSVIRFINRAAENQFGWKSNEYLGTAFTHPLAIDEVKMITIHKKDEQEVAVEMHVQQTIWEAQTAFIVSLSPIN